MTTTKKNLKAHEWVYDGGPLTTESEVRVRNPETGEEGYRAVRWNNCQPSFFGGVYQYRANDCVGAEVDNPVEAKILAKEFGLHLHNVLLAPLRQTP